MKDKPVSTVSGRSMHHGPLSFRSPSQLEHILLDLMLLRNSPITRLHLRSHLRTMEQLDSRAQSVYIKLLYFLLLLVFLRLIVRIKNDSIFVRVEGLWGGRGEWERERGRNVVDAECERVVQGSTEEGWGRTAVHMCAIGGLASGGCWRRRGAEFVTQFASDVRTRL
jgi:hypothetical protein